MKEQKPTKVFWQIDPDKELFAIDGKEGKLITEEQRQKLMKLMESQFDFITVRYEKLPTDNLIKHTIKFNNE